ncbi:transporter substrate-binding domain-containing protein [Herminiimonas sp. CN]|uniref:transporter substrate-binding domain-containing protein n=1 Tax=Herminiimonas sp. CN TaxID=1349818 RepID=UPI000A62C5B3|nr:transporter substrate-binding domain-containing protein [Herminiimonas sp. CN]
MKLKHLVAVIGLSCVVSAQAADLKELRVGQDPTYEPFEYKTPDGKLVGFEVDIANALCAEMKMKCVFFDQSWEGIIPSLLAKKYDVIISSMSATDERQKNSHFLQ